MKMTPGTGTINNYSSFTKNCTLGQFPYKIPVNSLSDVQLYIDIGVSSPSVVQYELLHTCGDLFGQTEAITTASYVIGQDTHDNYYGVFKDFTGATPTCFVIAITLDSQIYFSEEYCVEPACNDLELINGCYGNLDPLISYDREGIYFGVSQGGTMGDETVVYEHKALMRGVEVTLNAIKNTFKQGRTRNFRTESEDIFLFWAEHVPEWYIKHIDAIFKRGEIFVGSTRYLVNETAYEKIEDCFKRWKPSATLKESQYQSFTCEVDPCGPPETTPCCDPTNVSADVNVDEINQIVISFTPCSPAPTNGYNIQWRVKGSADPYTDAGNFSSSPATIEDNVNPIGTDYEGFIRADCCESGESGSSGESGECFGSEVSWDTTTEESGSTYDIHLTSPCWGIESTYLVSGGTVGDVIIVRATFNGQIQKISGLFTRANVLIFSPNGGSDDDQSTCYTDNFSHAFNIDAEITINMASDTEYVSLAAVTHNSSSSMSSVTLEIIEINGNPVSIQTSGCKGNSSTGGTC